MVPMGDDCVKAFQVGDSGCSGASSRFRMSIFIKLWMFNGIHRWRSSSFKSHLTLAYLRSPKIKCGFTNLMVVDFYKACLMDNIMMAPTSTRMPIKIGNKSTACSQVTSLIQVDGIRRVQMKWIHTLNIRSISLIEKEMGLPLLESFHCILRAASISRICCVSNSSPIMELYIRVSWLFFSKNSLMVVWLNHTLLPCTNIQSPSFFFFSTLA